MDRILLGFLTGLSLILALGPQNLFVIEQGLKKNYIFTVCLICTMSDVLFIFLGIFLFSYFSTYNQQINNLLTILLIIFISNFIWGKVKTFSIKKEPKGDTTRESFQVVILKTLAFTYLNPHVFSDTILILGGFSKSFSYIDKLNFGLGGSIASLLYFFLLGYGSSYFSKKLNNHSAWLYINSFIILYMSALLFFVTYRFLAKVLEKSI